MIAGRTDTATGAWTAAVPTRWRRPLGRLLQGVAVLGAIVSVVVAIVGWRVAGAIDDVAVDSAQVTADALVQLEQTLEIAAGLVESVDTTLAALEGTLATTTSSLGDGNAALQSVSALAEDAAPALESATATLRRLEAVGSSIDSALQGLAALPFGPSYDPADSFGTTVGQLADDLEPLSTSFDTTAEDLAAVAASTDDLQRDLTELTASVGDAAGQLESSGALIESYRSTADRARDAARTAEQAVGGDLTVLRTTLVLGGIAFALGQLVPWVVGLSLIAAAPSARDHEGR